MNYNLIRIVEEEIHIEESPTPQNRYRHKITLGDASVYVNLPYPDFLYDDISIDEDGTLHLAGQIYMEIPDGIRYRYKSKKNLYDRVKDALIIKKVDDAEVDDDEEEDDEEEERGGYTLLEIGMLGSSDSYRFRSLSCGALFIYFIDREIEIKGDKLLICGGALTIPDNVQGVVSSLQNKCVRRIAGIYNLEQIASLPIPTRLKEAVREYKTI